jgi:hypothetical protein
MSYRNKTYIIFDGDEDMWAYAFMKGWKEKEHIDFNFHDAHDINELRDGSSEEVVKRKLRERLANTKQAIVLIGEKTKNLHRYVRWEIDCCLEKDIPIIGVNLNGKARIDDGRCPPIMKDQCVLYVPFKMEPIKRALDGFCPKYQEYKRAGNKAMYYPDLGGAS